MILIFKNQEERDDFIEEIKKLQLKHTLEVVRLADKYNLDRNSVFREYTLATTSVCLEVNFENPKFLGE